MRESSLPTAVTCWPLVLLCALLAVPQAACTSKAGGGYFPGRRGGVNPRFSPDTGPDALPDAAAADTGPVADGSPQDTHGPDDPDTQVDGAAVTDSGSVDSAPVDSAPVDSGPADGGPVDGGVTDSGVVDGGQPDAGPPDAGPGGCPADCPNGPQCLAWAKPETCNGIDDDCDGSTDDNSCNDGNDCTIDACAGPESGCKHVAMGDGQPCGVGKACNSGACVPVGGQVGPPTPGSLVITELMANPASVTDNVGEWFEIHNPGLNPIKLDGLILADVTGKYTVSAPDLQIAAGGWLVFGRNSDQSKNGGVPVDQSFSVISLNNSTETLRLELADGTLIDQVAYTPDGNGWPKLGNGASYQLTAGKYDATANDFGGNWCLGLTTFGAGDLGTPGKPNASCP